MTLTQKFGAVWRGRKKAIPNRCGRPFRCANTKHIKPGVIPLTIWAHILTCKLFNGHQTLFWRRPVPRARELRAFSLGGVRLFALSWGSTRESFLMAAFWAGPCDGFWPIN